VTYMFLHADVGHFFGNMIFLWVFGDNLEEALGRVRFIIFYLVSGIVGAFAFVATDPHSHTPLIGASGAIAGVVVGYVMLRPCAKITVLFWLIPLRISAYWVVGAFAVLQFIHLGSSSPSEVAYWCHVGGMAAGAVLFLVLRPPGVKLFECIRAPFLPVEPAPDAPGGARGGWDPR
jgi:membrane associated rhomboid family serine protease